MSKGDKPRPVDKEKFDRNFDRIFGPKKDGSRYTVVKTKCPHCGTLYGPGFECPDCDKNLFEEEGS